MARPDSRLDAPLSFAQERLWFLGQLDPKAATYHVARALRLSGEVSPRRLATALRALIDRHEVLRTGYELGEHGQRQKVRPSPSGPARLPVVELVALGAPRASDVVPRLARAEARRPFDLSSEPALRLTWIRGGQGALAVEKSLLLLTAHHIATDGTSFPILYRELARFYILAELPGSEPLPPLPVQYADFALWQRQRLDEAAFARLLGEWRQELAGAPTAIELPTDRPRPRTFSARGAAASLALSPALALGLRAFAASSGSTPFVVALTAFALLLGRLGAGDDLLIGTAVAQRGRRELEALIGMFVNTVVLRLGLGGPLSFAAAVEKVRQASARALARQELPFEKLVEASEIDRDPSRPPLVQAMFLWQREETEAFALPGVEVEPVPRPREESQLELSLAIVEKPAGLLLHAQYASDLFDATRMRRLLAQFSLLLDEALATPETALGELPLLSPVERHQLEREWNDTASAGQGQSEGTQIEGTLVELVERSMAEWPDAVAVVDGHERLSYGALAHRVGALAGRLGELGAGPEVRVGVSLPRHTDLVVALLAVLRSGAAYVPLDPNYPAERLGFMVEDSGAFAVVAGERERRRLPLSTAANPPSWVLPKEHGTASLQRAQAGHLAYLIYTSGSTGRPKAVAIEHRSAVAMVGWARSTYSRRELAGVMLATSIAFDLSVFELFVTLDAGGKVILGDNALSLAELPARHEVVLLNTVPSAANELERAAALPGSLRVINLAGEPLPGDLARRLLALPQGIKLWNLYGPSEDTTYSTAARVPTGTPARWGEPTLGRPLADTQALVLDRAGFAVPLGVPGELWLTGVGLARGYLGRSAFTADRFRPHPSPPRPGARAYRTGDLVRFLPWGELEFLGRFDHQVKVRGFRIELGEIEGALLAQPGVREAVVVARREGDALARLVAYVAGPAAAAADELAAALGARLPQPMVPSAFVVLAALPRLPNRKVDRKALPAPEELSSAEESSEPPRGPFELAVAEVFTELLGLSSVGRYDDFFARGGHSLLAVQVISRLADRLGVTLPLSALFEHSRLLELAAAVACSARACEAALPPLRRSDALPPVASFAQQRLWFLDRLRPGDPAYNLPLVYRLRGTLSLPALYTALDALLERHEALRTAFSLEGEPRPQSARLPLGWVDLEALGNGETLARRLARAEAHRPFDLSQAPLVRARWVSWRRDLGLLLLTQHHIASDGWSIGVLTAELATLYQKALTGQEPTLPPLALRYQDFAVWQRQALDGAGLASRLGFWRERLAGAPEQLELPTDRPRPAVATTRGARWGWQLGSRDLTALSAAARRHRATLFTLLLAAYATFLGRRSGQGEVVVGLAVAGRDSRELQGLVGFFVNTLPLRLELAGDPTVAERVSEVRSRLLETLGAPEVPFEQLVGALAPARDPSRPPLLQTLFSLDPASDRALALAGLEVDRLPAVSDTAKLDFSLAASPRGGGLWLSFEYKTDLFDRTTVARWASELGQLFRAFAAAGPGPLSRGLRLAPAEHHQLLVEWNDTAVAQPEEPTLVALFAAQVAALPEAIAMVAGGLDETSEQWSYSHLHRRARRLAGTLVSRGVGPEARVGIWAGRAAATLEAMLAVMMAGAAYVPIDPDYPEERRRFLAKDSGVEWMLGTGAALGSESQSVEPLAPALPRVLPDNLCYLIYTSGSTGKPKGVAVTHRNVVRLVCGGGFARLDASTVMLQLGPVAFDASTYEFWAPLTHGGRLEIYPAGPPELGALAALLVARRITTLLITAGLFHSLVDEQPQGLAGLRELGAGGDALSPHHVRALTVGPGAIAGRVVVNAYGPTESSTLATCHRMTAGIEPGAPVPIGRGVGNTRLVVLGPRGEELALGLPGELAMGGLGLARGYWCRPALTAERFVPDGSGGPAGERLYLSGDRARRLASGSLEFLGRLDGQVKIRGFRIEIGEVEAVLAALDGVLEAVVAVRIRAGEKHLVAFLVVDSPARTGESLRADLAARLPAYLLPAAFVVLPALPQTAHGKVDRRALPEPSWGDADRFEPPRGATELRLAALFGDLLATPKVGRFDDFFALGGHSLLATRLISRLRRELGVELPLQAVFEFPRLADLARAVDGASRSILEPPLTRLEHLRPPPLSFAQLRLWLLDRLDPGSTAAGIPFQIDLAGTLVAGAWAEALALVEARQEGLRTSFPLVDDEPVQHLAAFSPRPLPVVDLSLITRAAERLAEASRRHRFDLAIGPLFARVLLRLAPDRHRVLANLHHSIADGWSVGLLLNEWVAFYRGALAAAKVKLSPLPVSYADYSVWQRRALNGEGLATQLDFWRQELAGAPPRLELPTDRPRPVAPSFRGGKVRHILAPELSAKLARFGREHGATLFMVHSAALAAVLSRWSGQDEVLVGTPVAGRNRVELEGLIGCFLNTLVLRLRLSPQLDFASLVAAAKVGALAAYAHQEVPFERLLDELQIERDLSRTPLFQVFLNVLNLPRHDLSAPGLGLTLHGHTEVEAKFDLTLYVLELGEGLGWNLVYNADLFSPPRMAELVAQLELLLTQALAAPTRPLGAHSLVTTAARQVLPDPAALLPRDFFGTVPEVFARQAVFHPQRLAVVDGLGCLRYVELVAAMHRVAGALLATGLRRGERVGIWAARSASLTAAVLGALEAGGVYFILDPAYPEARLVSFVELANPKALLRLEAAGELPGAVAEALDRVGCRACLTLPARASDLAAEPDWRDVPASAPEVSLGADDPASLGFTSGSTGQPKAVLGRHGSLTHFNPWRARRFGLGPEDRFTLLSGLAHDPLQRDLFTPLQLGASIHVPDPSRIGEPGYLGQWLHRQGITVTHLTPAMAQLVTTASSVGGDCSGEAAVVDSLRYAVLVGDVLTVRDVARLVALAPGVTVINHYGATETQRAVSYHVVSASEGGEPANEVLPLGRSIAGMQLLVLRPDGGLCGVGELGELVFRSPHLALGYLDDPELTARKFSANPTTGESWDRLYRTGDLGRYRPDGEVVFAGRIDTQVKIRGFRVEPGEIAAVLASDPRVEDVAVVPFDRPLAAHGEVDRQLVAYVVARPELSAEAARTVVGGRLPEYMVPAAVVFLDHLPMTPNGKLDRRALPAPSFSGEALDSEPETELERWLAGLWRELLGVLRVGRQDSFFALGGHSLLATRLLSRLARDIDVQLPLRAVFSAPRLEEMAREIEALLVAEEG